LVQDARKADGPGGSSDRITLCWQGPRDPGAHGGAGPRHGAAQSRARSLATEFGPSGAPGASRGGAWAPSTATADLGLDLLAPPRLSRTGRGAQSA